MTQLPLLQRQGQASSPLEFLLVEPQALAYEECTTLLHPRSSFSPQISQSLGYLFLGRNSSYLVISLACTF